MLLILTTDEERNVDDARATWDEAKALYACQSSMKD
jgi:hypothetical protein